MSMSRKFKAAKIQLTFVGEKHPKGVKHVLNNVTENVSEEQFNLLSSAMETLTTERVTGADVISTQSISLD
ncbi:DUF1659 domain-containing protein [Limosilactobacillus vaginalis]|uniref:DUF1659 domain-containing protein n=1 Tax=Limosilactobacillus vaginalis TaxID=1633 RepID=UPI00288BDF02|nr:hypothetical protein [Limosilactobacillus vaginalis]